MENAPEAALKVAVRVRVSTESRWIGCRLSADPVRAGTAKVRASRLTLKTTVTRVTRRSSVPALSDTLIATTPGTWLGPVLWKATRSRMSWPLRRRSNGRLRRSSNSSRKYSRVAAMSTAVGFSVGSASSGVASGQLAWLSPAGGRPTPQLFVW